jgi:hypothetical protein
MKVNNFQLSHPSKHSNMYCKHNNYDVSSFVSKTLQMYYECASYLFYHNFLVLYIGRWHV